MATLTEALSNLEKEKKEQITLNPSKFVYVTPSGTKDIHIKWTVGGRAYKQKKVYRNPQPIFGMDEISFESPESATSRLIMHKKPIQASSGVVNISQEPKLDNTDTKPERAFSNKVYGLHRMGGSGVDFADAHIEKLEELKLLKDETGIELRFKQKEQASGKWKGGL